MEWLSWYRAQISDCVYVQGREGFAQSSSRGPSGLLRLKSQKNLAQFYRIKWNRHDAVALVRRTRGEIDISLPANVDLVTDASPAPHC